MTKPPLAAWLIFMVSVCVREIDVCNRRASSSRPPRPTSRSSGPKQDRPQSSSAETWCALFLPPVLHSLSLTASFLCLSRPTLRVQIAESGECLWELSLATHPGLEQRISPPRDNSASASAKPFSELSGAHRKLVLPQEPNIPIPDRVARGRSPMRSAYVAQPERLIAAQDEKVLMRVKSFKQRIKFKNVCIY